LALECQRVLLITQTHPLILQAAVVAVVGLLQEILQAVAVVQAVE
jgi:hypothetical protein